LNTTQDILNYAKLHNIHLNQKDGQLKIDGSKVAITSEFISAAKEHKSDLLTALNNQQVRLNPEMESKGYQWCFDCTHWNGQCSSKENPYAATEKHPEYPRKCKWYEV